MEFTAEQIAQYLNGTVDGDPKASVNTIAKIEDGKEGALSFLANPKYAHYVYDCQSSIILLNNDFVAEKEIPTTVVRVENAYACFAKLLELYNSQKPQPKGISEKSEISENSSIGEEAYIGAFAFVGENTKIGKNVKIYPQVFIGNNVKIGDGTTLFAGVKVYDDCVIGNDCTIHASTVIGADGFGFAPNNDTYDKVPQIGNVVIEDHVEIGANTCVDRATIGSTIIRKGVKLDNFLQVAHNVEIGENTVMAAHCGISGSTKIGSNCMIGGQVGFAGHIKVGNRVMIGAQSGVINDINDGSTIIGSPAIDSREFKKMYIYTKGLAKLNARVKTIEKNSK